MKILLIDVNCKYSSTGKMVYDLYTHINEKGDESAVCYGRGEKVKDKNIFKFSLDWETYLHAFLTRITGYTGCFSFLSTRRLLNYIKVFKPDVVHIHELHAYFINIKPLLLYLKENHIKTIITLHCEFTYTGKCGHSYNCDKWKSECGNCPHLHDYPSTLLFDHTRYMFQQKKKLLEDFKELIIVTPSKWLADRVNLSFLKSHKTVVIHNGVNTEIFYPKDATDLREKYNISEEEKVVLAVAPNLMSPEKGGEYVLKLAKELEGKKIRFILIGVDNDQIKIKENIVMEGIVSDQNLLSQYYSLADAFIICSVRETFSMTCAEALCCGTPIVGFRCGAPETIFPEPYAHFVEYGDVKALCYALQHVLDHQLPVGAFSDMYMHFSIQRMCKEYLDIYESNIANNS